MAVAGGAKPSVQMHIKDRKLIIGSAAMRQGVINSVAVATHKLMNGEIVFVQQFGNLVEQVTEAVNADLLHHK